MGDALEQSQIRPILCPCKPDSHQYLFCPYAAQSSTSFICSSTVLFFFSSTSCLSRLPAWSERPLPPCCGSGKYRERKTKNDLRGFDVAGTQSNPYVRFGNLLNHVIKFGMAMLGCGLVNYGYRSRFIFLCSKSHISNEHFASN